MKKTMLSAAILLSLAGVSMSANAAEIQFAGKISAQTCKLDSDNLTMKLPTVGINDVAEIGKVRGITTMTASVNCEGATETNKTVTMSLMPLQGSYTAKSILKNTAAKEFAAAGVGIVVLDENAEAFDFDSGIAAIEAPLVNNAANIQISAAYVKDSAEGEIKPGDVNAVLPFVMTYQ